MTQDLRQRKIRLGDLLVQAGLISEAQLQLALQDQKRTGSKLGRTVLDLGFSPIPAPDGLWRSTAPLCPRMRSPLPRCA